MDDPLFTQLQPNQPAALMRDFCVAAFSVAKALRKLKHPSRSRKLRSFLDT